MGLLDRHISSIKSEEFVLGVSTGFKGEAGTKFADIESTKMEIVSRPVSKNWTGFQATEKKLADASVGASMVGRQFPARCLVTFERRSDKKTTVNDGRSTTTDIEILVATGIEYICAVDLVDVKEKKVA